ncbi:MAG: serpin family protein [Bacteroidaceae bacterium]|nr:serpin family protein [Bacteroidaceae bacterium]
MELGKKICQALKELRKRIAGANDIPFEVEDCTHKGDCPGTCPKCESELRYLKDSIDKREREGKPVVLEGIMGEEELRKKISGEPVEQGISEEQDIVEEQEMGMQEPPEPLMGIPLPPLGGEPSPYSNYSFVSTIASALMRRKNSNFVYSPAGLCFILEILQKGMDVNGELYDKIDEIISGFRGNIKNVDNENCKLVHATSIWYNKAIGAIKKEFLDYIKDVYDTETHDVDFEQTAETKLKIDNWVSDKTHQMIRNLDTELSGSVLMLVLDAIYMKAKWESPFDPDCTERDTFHNADGSESEVDMMYQEIEDARYAETRRYQLIRLPYKTHGYSMVLILPKEGNAVEDIVSNENWFYKTTDWREVDLYMPRFKFDNTLSFREILSNLGLDEMFYREDAFPHMTNWPLYVSQIKQQCVIDVKEEGTEAAAITFAEGVGCCPPPDDIPQRVTMRIDRPFGFAISGEYNQILFMGVVRDMKK